MKTSAERLIAEWAPGKVRILKNGSYWWCWDGGGYTSDMASAGLYDAGRKSERPEDRIIPVDPERFPIDAIMQRMRALESEKAGE